MTTKEIINKYYKMCEEMHSYERVINDIKGGLNLVYAHDEIKEDEKKVNEYPATVRTLYKDYKVIRDKVLEFEKTDWKVKEC